MYPYRYKILLIVFVLFFIGIGARLFQLQIMETDKYKGISKNRRIASFPLETARGAVFDRNGHILAIDQHTFDVSVQYKNLLYSYLAGNRTVSIPRVSAIKAHNRTGKACAECHENQDLWLKKLSPLLGIPPHKLLGSAKQVVERVEKLKQNVEQKFGRATRIKEEADYYPVASDVAWEKIIQIEVRQDNFPGIRVIPRPTRTYPEQELAAHILGYMGKLNEAEWKEYSDNWSNFVQSSDSANTDALLYDGYAENDSIGRAGVEARYEEDLRGLRGKRFEEITCKNAQIEKVILERPSVSGSNLYLTIDKEIQACAEKALGTNLGALVVMDPWTGEILAMASSPRFNPNTVNEDFNKLIKHPSKPFLNRAIQGTLPPGSIFKVVTATAALSSQRITTKTAYECQGFTTYKNITFKCWCDAGHGIVTIEDAIPYSCNVFFFDVAKILGSDTLSQWSKNFGVNEKTGIDLPHERSGNLPRMPNTASVMNTSIGQGSLLTTPLQLARMYAAIANGGTMVQPHLLLKLTNSRDEIIRTFRPKNLKKLPAKPLVLDVLRTALQDVVIRGTAKHKGLEIFKVAGKTGTAETGRQKDNHAWFVGYAPYDNPRYSFAILVEHTPGHGADVAVPIARELLSHLFPEAAEAL